jgi:hypothetical protein
MTPKETKKKKEREYDIVHIPVRGSCRFQKKKKRIQEMVTPRTLQLHQLIFFTLQLNRNTAENT